MLTLPETFRTFYPNPVQKAGNAPVIIFRDHRWTIPLLALAGEQGLIRLPATIVSFDRHRDALDPANGTEPLERYRRGQGNVAELISLVRVQLSPRDDDWIKAGMELGLIGNTVQFSSDLDMTAHEEPVMRYTDRVGVSHRMFRLGRPQTELSYKGALADDRHQAVWQGLWDVSGWNPAERRFTAPYVLDLDLDYWSISWDRHTFPFSPAVFEGEFGAVCQSPYAEAYPVIQFFLDLVRGTPLVTIATEPDHCGGVESAQVILEGLNRYLFGGALALDRVNPDSIAE